MKKLILAGLLGLLTTAFIAAKASNKWMDDCERGVVYNVSDPVMHAVIRWSATKEYRELVKE